MTLEMFDKLLQCICERIRCQDTHLRRSISPEECLIVTLSHYVITVPAHFKEGTEGKACVTFLDLKGPTDIKIELKHEEQVRIVTEQKITAHDHSECYAFQVPQNKDDHSWFLHVSAHGENINVDESKKITILKAGDDVCIIQTDKSTYKPGDIVKFRVISINSDFKPLNKQHHLVEIIDPLKNRIAQWLDVSTKQGFADLTFHLAEELSLGDYRINIPDGCVKYFSVAEYVSQRFEFNLNIPSEVSTTDKSFHLEACGNYIYGKPVEGVIDLSVCATVCENRWYCRTSFDEEETVMKNCIDIKGEKTDDKGCVSRDIHLSHFNLSTTEHNLIEIKSKLTEDGTGHSEEASDHLDLSSGKKTVKFEECERFYRKGFPYHGKVKVSDEKKKPMVNTALTLAIMNQEENYNTTHMNLVTDSHGIAHFTLETHEWQSVLALKVRLSSDDQNGEDEDYNLWDYEERYTEDWHYIVRFYSKSKSLLSIQKHPEEVSCNSEQSATVEYNIHTNLDSDTDHLHFFYILLSKSGIFSYKEHTVDVKDQAKSPNLQGSFPLNFHVDEDFFPRFSLLVFSVLPNGETIAMATDYNVSPCGKSKVKLSFSEEQVRPGENVNLEVTAEAGSLCSVRSVDKGYLLKNPHSDNNLISDVTTRLRQAGHEYSYWFLEPGRDEDHCPENTTARTEEIFDVYKLFLTQDLLIFTNTEVKEPVKCVSHDIAMRSSIKKKKPGHKETKKEIQKPFTRTYFPDNWIYKLVSIGSEGHTVLNQETPHTITKWVTDAFCLGSSGFAISGEVELTTFQPYFIDLILPQSVVQGEKFTIQAVVFSYVKKCILIVVSLSDSEDLRTANEKDQSRCVCEGHSHMFSWDVSAIKPKTLKVHVNSGSIEVEGDCKQDVLAIGEDHRKDSVEKTIVVKPRGYEDEKTKTFLLLPSDNREALSINIDTPERLVAGSERAHIIILGDLMANIVANLDDIDRMPDACAEQNAAKFARYVYTLKYLESIQELTPEQKAKSIESLVEGYQKQLTFRTENGSFTTFPGGSANIWLTAFTIKAFNGAQKFIYIDESHIQQTVNWLHSKQQPDGCFSEEGEYYNNEIDIDDPVPRTAYITIALLEHHVVYNGTIVENALSCLRKSVDQATSENTQALLAYAFTLSGDNELRDQILKKLDISAITKASNVYDGEMQRASYAILTILSEKTTTPKNLEDAGDLVRWIVKHQNAWGGFYSSQDTTLAIQALAQYAKAINHKKGDSTVTIKSKSGFEKTIHVDKSNNLLVQTVDLPEIPGEYTVSATGDGFVYLQSHLHCNVLPEKTEKEYFSFNVSTEPSTCNHASWKRFDVHIDVSYSGKRENTNMAMIIVETVSGFIPDKDSVKKLKKNPLVERTEVSAENITIYLSKLTHEPVSFVFSLEQEAPVQNLQPASAVVFDYYDPEEYTVVEYSAPCSEVIPHCAVSAEEREDCGYPNISQDQCHQKGCCYDHSIPGTKWCFFQGFRKTQKH
ncbi:alpha-2-macroglobulin-like protein 1 [Hyla sarda]|uniref:alpha-2-macroglobulin-like protein 1 n=1 Tax=Hyla sarda TaxID=327740 RepID=UPI0024C3C986|nr:alpha-2-macroglobulin-like protein 1 [Hyla sarda]